MPAESIRPGPGKVEAVKAMEDPKDVAQISGLTTENGESPRQIIATHLQCRRTHPCPPEQVRLLKLATRPVDFA